MAAITKVPNGPLIKKKGPFKGSTLKSGGIVKKAQGGISKKNSKDTVEVKIGNQTYVTTRPKNQGPKWVNNPMPPSNEKEKFPMPSQRLMDSVANYTTKNFDTAKLMKKKAQSGAKVDAEKYLEESKKRVKKIVTPLRKAEVKKGINTYEDYLKSKVNKKSKMKAGGMIKRADGSMSRHGLWDSIRENKGSGKKPTAAILKQEKKIKAKSKK